MFKSLSLAAFLVSSYAPATYAAAIPNPTVDKVYPEIYPGPGMPSLASLGLTSAKLYQMTPKNLTETTGKLVPRFQGHCENRRDTANVDDVIACYNYLQSVGNNQCQVPGDNNQHIFCSIGTANVRGVSLVNQGTQTACFNVANAVQYLYTNCNSDGQVGGNAAANGDGDLVVLIDGNCLEPPYFC